MEKILLNDDFMDFVNSQMSENCYILNKIGEYKKYNSYYSNINDSVQYKMKNKKDKKILEKAINYAENISKYENAFAYYLGMRQALSMLQLEEK